MQKHRPTGIRDYFYPSRCPTTYCIERAIRVMAAEPICLIQNGELLPWFAIDRARPGMDIAKNNQASKTTPFFRIKQPYGRFSLFWTTAKQRRAAS